MKLALGNARPAAQLRRGLLGLILLASAALAQPALTTIQDTVYLADGNRFNGLALIDWKSFDTPNGSVIGQYSRTTRIVDGLLRVQLAPTTASNKAYYSVKYMAEGRIVFSEVWAVGATTRALRLREVRAVLLPGGYVSLSSSGTGGTTGGDTGGGTGPILGQDNSGSFVDAETPGGAIDGNNLVFTLASAPTPASSLSLYLNGLQMSAGVDYTVAGAAITFVTGVVPQPGDVIRAYYRTGSIPIASHNLLSTVHGDTTPATVVRGDLVVGQFASSAVTWNRLALGAANTCLRSDGSDAVWNSCLLTNLGAGAIPFINSSQTLAQDTQLNWDSTNKRLGLGTSAPTANLTVRALSTQGTTQLSSWQNASGTVVSRVAANGNFATRRHEVIRPTDANGNVTDTSDATYSDIGLGPDPTNRVNGDFWYSTSQSARKTYEGGQVHTTPQVLCSTTAPDNPATSSVNLRSTTLTEIANCLIPRSFFDAGDRLEVIASIEHVGNTSGFSVELRSGSNQVYLRNLDLNQKFFTLRASAGVYGSGIAWGVLSFTDNAGGFDGLSSNTNQVPTDQFVLNIRMSVANANTTDYLIVRNYSIVRYPAQSNPCRTSRGCTLAGSVP
jgi:hypothetical protein